jgi:hypothetical protein
MSNDDTRSAPPPGVNLKGFQELKLLQAELLVHDSQLQNFSALRERLVASGQDANAKYRQIEARRDHVMAELKKLTPAPVRPATAAASVQPLRPGGSLLSLPIAPVRFIPPIGPWFGYSGTLQMGRASEGVGVVPQGPYPISGYIYTVALDDTGGITFYGDLAVGPQELPQNQYDPSLNYFWLQNWTYLIPFPAPVVESTFTYSFDVFVLAGIFRAGGYVTLYSFVSVGETANFVGQDVVVNTDAGWPLVADLTQPNLANGSLFNGTYGSVQGQLEVQRSFVVAGGQVPAVALVVGVISAQSMMSEVSLAFGEDANSYISPGSYTKAGYPGFVNFRYDPKPLIYSPPNPVVEP